MHSTGVSNGLVLHPLIDRMTGAAGDNVALKRNLAERDARIAALEERPRSPIAAAESLSDRACEARVFSGSASQTRLNPCATVL